MKLQFYNYNFVMPNRFDLNSADDETYVLLQAEFDWQTDSVGVLEELYYDTFWTIFSCLE